jgi:anti-sigma-K factor RskA
MSDRPDMERDDDMLAAEYVLRLLEGDELAALEARLHAEPELAARVGAWHARLGPIADEIGPVAPPPALKARLGIALFGEPERPAPLLARLWFWRGLSLAALALAAALGLLLLRPGPPPGGGPILTADISAEDAGLRLIAVYDAAEGQLRLSRAAGGAAAGRALELWAIAGDAAPVSLGVLPESPAATVVLPDDMRPPAAGTVFAISDEPPGGSPTGQPTGAVLATGAVTEL